MPKRIFLIVPILLLILALVWPTAYAQQLAPGELAQTIGRVNVRQNATTGSPVVEVLEEGTVVTVRSVIPTGRVITIEDVTSSLWYEIELADGRNGFVWYGLLERVGGPTMTPSPLMTFTPLPTPTNAPEIESIIASLGISPASGHLDTFVTQRIMDLSDLNGEFRWTGFGDYGRNFVLRTLIEWGPGPAEDACGFFFREGFLDSYYTVEINRVGELLFRGRYRSDWIVPYVLGDGSAIRREPDAQNELILVILDDVFTVYINGQYAGQFSDATLENGFNSVMGLSSGPPQQRSCTFRDIWSWVIEEAVTPQPSATASPLPTLLPEVDIDPASAVLSDVRDLHTIDLTDEDNLYIWESLVGNFPDFVLSSTFYWGPGATGDDCGFLFRHVNDDNFYTLTLDRNGGLGFQALVNDVWDDFVGGDGSFIHTGPQDSNRLVLVGQGSTFTVYVNGSLAAQFQDSRFENGGYALLGGTDDESDETFCRFEDAYLWNLTDTVAQIASPTATATLQPSSHILDTLARLDLDSYEGRLVDTIDNTRIDMTGDDNLRRTEFLGGIHENYVIATTFRWGPGAVDDECGFRFRSIDSVNMFALITTREAEVIFQTQVDDRWGDWIYVDSNALRTGPATENELVLLVLGDTYSVYVNGKLAGEYQDDRLQGGRVGILAGTENDSDVSYCDFRDSWLWEITEPLPSPTAAPTTTPLPTATPMPTSTPGPDVSLALGLAGLSERSGYLAERLPLREFRLAGGIEGDFGTLPLSDVYSDFAMHATIQVGESPEVTSCGFYFRQGGAEGENGYALTITPDQELSLLALADDVTLSSSRRFSEAIRTGPNAVNSLLLVAVGTEFHVYVNDLFVAWFQDEAFSQGGGGIIAFVTDSSTGMTCRFSDVWLWELTESVTLPPTPTPGASVAEVSPEVAAQLDRIGIESAEGQLAYQRDSLSIGPLTSDEDELEFSPISGTYDDFVLGVDIGWGPGSATDACGLYFGYWTGPAMQTATISQRQTVFVHSLDDEGNLSNSVNFQAYDIQVGPQASNHLDVVVSGQTFSLYVNGVYRHQWQDPNYNGGFAGMQAIRVSESPASSCEFSNIFVWEPAAPLPLVPAPTATAESVPTTVLDALDTMGIDPRGGSLSQYYTQNQLHRTNAGDSILLDDLPGDYDDFVMSTSIRWEARRRQDLCGFIFRVDDDAFYTLTANSEGVFYSRPDNGMMEAATQIGDQAPFEDQINTLRVVAQGETFSVYLNDSLIGEFQDSSQRFGETGLLAALRGEHTQPGCHFSETWLWDLGELESGAADPTATFTLPVESDVQAVLDALDIKVESGYEADRIGYTEIPVEGPMPMVVSVEFDGQYENFLFSSTVTWGAELADIQACGIFFRRSTDLSDHYFLRIIQAGRLYLSHIDGVNLLSEDEQILAAMPQGEGESFSLWVVAAKDLVNVYIDGDLVAVFAGLESRPGGLFLVADSDQTGHSCIFRNAWVWDLAYSTPRMIAPDIDPKDE